MTTMRWFIVVLLAAAPNVGFADEAADRLAAGIQQVQDGDLERAILTLDEAVRELVARPGREREAAQGYVYLGMAYLRLEQEELARSKFKEALKQQPDLKLSATSFPPKIIRVFEAARAELGVESGAARGGGRTTLWVGGAAAAAAAAGAGALVLGKKDPLETDDDGDGVSERAGDCNDADRDVKPDGGFILAVDHAFTGASGCEMRNARQQSYRVNNRSCVPLTIESLRQTLTFTGNCTGDGQYPLEVTQTSVAAASTAVIRVGAPPGRVTALCCPQAPCGTGTCTVNEAYTLTTTTAGSQTVRNTFSVAMPISTSCPACPVDDWAFRPAESASECVGRSFE